MDIEKIKNLRIPRFAWDYEDLSETDLWFLMAIAYQESSQHLFSEMIDNKLGDTFHHAKVAVYLMTHAVEIFLKGGVLLSGEAIQTNHRLKQLFGQFQKLYPGKRFEFTCSVSELVEP